MDLRLKDKVALVIGGSEGIGKGIARVLAREGIDVGICARRRDVLDKAAQEIRSESGRQVLAISADLTRREEPRISHRLPRVTSATSTFS